jgi:hypothetical protein
VGVNILVRPEFAPAASEEMLKYMLVDFDWSLYMIERRATMQDIQLDPSSEWKSSREFYCSEVLAFPEW